ncbi:18020_t:CDS:2 [Acaulospora morrowiae]|uniref:18020_t:CDS:1 n=1 Tax=Acaulospora morrowiae TaxID=94023 RepID=A0A9N9BTK2_9GLOM|nr:18020_t:CDS:2 [Acaulospora morrowiae]
MGRMHAPGKGIASSALPYRRTPPSWLKTTPEDVCEQIFKFAKKGMTPSQIGVNLRDSHGIAQVKNVTGNKILRILKSNGNILIYRNTRFDLLGFNTIEHVYLTGLAPEIPEDLYHLIKKAVADPPSFQILQDLGSTGTELEIVSFTVLVFFQMSNFKIYWTLHRVYRLIKNRFARESSTASALVA